MRRINAVHVQRRVGFGEVALDASALPIPEDVPLKPPSEWRLIGRPLARRDAKECVTGRATFGLDVRLPGMLYATIERAPVKGGSLKSLDDSAARALPGRGEGARRGYGGPRWPFMTAAPRR